MKNTSKLIVGSFWTRMGWIMLFFMLPLVTVAQGYEKLWKEVESFRQKDLPRSAMKQMDLIYEKASKEQNKPQILKVLLAKVMEKVSLTPDSAEVEVKRLKEWAVSEDDKVLAALLYHVIGNIEMQRETADWKVAMDAYKCALKERELLLNTSADSYAPMVVSTTFSERFFQNNLYDLLARQSIAGLMANWRWRKNVEVQEWIIDLYDTLIDAYGSGGLNRPTAALLAHEAKVMFLSESGVVNKYHLSNEKTEKALRDLLAIYESKAHGDKSEIVSAKTANGISVDALVDVRLKLAEVLCNQQRLVEAMQVLQTAQRMYPKTTLDSALKGKIEWIKSPSLSVEVPVVYPLYKGELKVDYKNITEFQLETYRLDLHPSAAELNGELQFAELCRSAGKKVSVQRYMLPETDDFKAHVAKLAYRLPEAGIYVLKLSPKGLKEKCANYQLLYVAPYQCVMIPLLDGRTEVVVVDRITGNPVPRVEVVKYDRNGYSAQFTSPKSWKTNRQGSVILKNPQQGALFVNARTPNCDFMKISSFYPNRNTRYEEEATWSQLTTLYTDRALYRPGQLVHVSGIRYEQMGDSLRTLQGKVIKVELLDVNGKKVGEVSATSDLFGVFAVDFTLPSQVLPGNFTLRTAHKATSIRVENYKRPTFDVVFDPIKKSYTFDDVVRAEGKVQHFAGAPVRLAKGTFTVVRSEAWLWRSGGAETALATGTFTTDADGKFSFDVTLEAPVNQEESYVVPYYNYVVRAKVTNGAGETQETVLTLPVGKQSLGIQIKGLKSKLACERKEKIQFQTMNLSKQLVNTEVTYQVFRLHETDSGQQEKLRTSDKPVFEGKAMSQKSFVPLEIYALPAGKYRLIASVRDDQGRLVTSTQDFILFSLTGKRPPIQTKLWFYQDGNNWKDGKAVTFYVGSSEDDVYLMMDVFSVRQRIRSERILMKNRIHKFEFVYDESYGDGIVVSFAFLREGKFYSKQVKLEKPKPQKKLTLQWETFRDQLIPGQQEVWRMKITDRSGNPVHANLLGTLYDASLDKIQSHNWWLQPSLTRWLPYVGVRSFSEANKTLFYVDLPYIQNENGYRLLGHDTYSRLLAVPVWNCTYYYYPTRRVYASPSFAMKTATIPNGVMANASGVSKAEDEFEVVEDENTILEVVPQTDASQELVSPQPLRQNFAETAFFYPTLRTDAKGEVSISFTLPDALTEWKFMGLAHTQDMDYGQLTSKVQASKPFMVQPNLPRFVRVGDASSLAVSLVNLSMESVKGKVRMELVDPLTDQVVFNQVRDFNVAEGESGIAQFTYKVVDKYDMLVCRVVAEAGEFSDGEQHYLPILTNKEWVTETIPFQLKGEESLDLSLEKLFNNQSGTATGRRLTVELTASPSWYVIQALSVIANPTNEDAISWATAYYANALALQLVRTHPRIREVLKLWMVEGATKETLWSKLEQHADLKQQLLEETPWLAEAQAETEQKRRVALLFELNGMEQRLHLAALALKKLQTAEGGWSWYPGMPVSRHTTTEVVELMARLKAKGVKLDAVMDEAYHRGLNFLQQEAKKEQVRILEQETRSDAKKHSKISRWVPSEQVIHFLYISALDGASPLAVDRNVNLFFIERLLHGGMKRINSIHQKAMLAIVFQANGKLAEASTLIQSIKEYVVSTPAMGSYFDTYKAAYSWYSYRIPTHVAAMEAIHRISPDVELLNDMKFWLLKQKQVQAWTTPLASVDAVYAFLMGSDQLPVAGKMKATLGDRATINKQSSGNVKVIETPNDVLGYTRATFMDDALPLFMGPSKSKSVPMLQVAKVGQGIGWGAVYAQYFEDMDKVNQSDVKGISIVRSYLLDGKPVRSNTALRVGDKLTIRLAISVDRDMDFISIRDQRAACMEPAGQLSGYSWNHGMSAYRVNRDASTEFFIDKLPKGKHLIEYQVYVNRAGNYQTGTAAIQSVYAPEFAAHTEGVTLEVRNE